MRYVGFGTFTSTMRPSTRLQLPAPGVRSGIPFVVITLGAAAQAHLAKQGRAIHDSEP